MNTSDENEKKRLESSNRQRIMDSLHSGAGASKKAVDPQVVQFWAKKLCNAGMASERAQAASELSRLYLLSRPTFGVRGSLSQPADAEMRSEEQDEVLAALNKEADVAVRREVAFALGQWGNQDAARALARIVENFAEEEEVRRAAIAGLGNIGGNDAVSSLIDAAEKDPSEAIRYDALSALTSLGLEEVGKDFSAVQSRVNRRGTSIPPHAGLSEEAHQVVETLRRICDNQNESEYIRRMAEAALEPWLQ